MPYFKTDLCTYYFQQKGSGTTLIFAHGLFVDHTIFRHQFEYLSSNYNCISFDMPGHGRSSFDQSGWTLDEIAEDISKFIKHYKIKKPVVVGQSQGGMVFMRLAVRHPELVGGLVLIGTSSQAEYESRFSFWKETISILETKSKTEIDDLMGKVQQGVVSEHFMRHNPSKAAEELKIMQSHDPIALKLATEAAVLYRTEFSDEIQKIECKSLIVSSKEDQATPLDISKMMANRIKNSYLKLIPNASHHIPIEAPEELTNSILEFLTKIDH